MLDGPVEYVVVAGHSMDPHFASGDLVIVKRVSQYHIGDVIAFKVPAGPNGTGGRVIHRIVGGSGVTGYEVKGDNRKSADLWHPKNTDVIGTVWVRLPHAARIARLLRSPLVIASLAAGLIFALFLGAGTEDKKRREA